MNKYNYFPVQVGYKIISLYPPRIVIIFASSEGSLFYNQVRLNFPFNKNSNIIANVLRKK